MSANQEYATDEEIMAMLLEGYPIKQVEVALKTSCTRARRLRDMITTPIKSRPIVFKRERVKDYKTALTADFLNGMSITKLQYKYGCGHKTVKKTLLDSGITETQMRSDRLKAETIDKVLYIIGARKNGEKYSQIEKSLGITRQAICALLRNYGDQFDPNNERKHKKSGPKQEIEQTMTQTQYRLNEWQELMFKHPRCKYCDEDASEAAHIVAQTKANIARYGFHCIHNHRNMVPTCHAHNSTAMNECRGDAMRDDHMSEIKKALEDEGVIK